MAPSSPYLQRLPPGRSRNLECVSKLVFGGSCRRTAPPGARRNALVTAHASAPGGAPRPAPPARRVLKRSLAVGVLLDATGVPLPGTRFQQFVVVGFAVIFYLLFQLIRAVDKLQRSVDASVTQDCRSSRSPNHGRSIGSVSVKWLKFRRTEREFVSRNPIAGRISCVVVESAGSVVCCIDSALKLAVLGHRPLVVLLQEHGSDQPDNSGGVRKDADDVPTTAWSLSFSHLNVCVLRSCRSCSKRQFTEGQDVLRLACAGDLAQTSVDPRLSQRASLTCGNAFLEVARETAAREER